MDTESLQQKCAAMALDASRRRATDQQAMRVAMPEFAAMVDDFRAVFGPGVKVRWVRYQKPDGTWVERGKKFPGTAVRPVLIVDGVPT